MVVRIQEQHKYHNGRVIFSDTYFCVIFKCRFQYVGTFSEILSDQWRHQIFRGGIEKAKYVSEGGGEKNSAIFFFSLGDKWGQILRLGENAPSYPSLMPPLLATSFHSGNSKIAMTDDL